MQDKSRVVRDRSLGVFRTQLVTDKLGFAIAEHRNVENTGEECSQDGDLAMSIQVRTTACQSQAILIVVIVDFKTQGDR